MNLLCYALQALSHERVLCVFTVISRSSSHIPCSSHAVAQRHFIVRNLLRPSLLFNALRQYVAAVSERYHHIAAALVRCSTWQPSFPQFHQPVISHWQYFHKTSKMQLHSYLLQHDLRNQILYESYSSAP